jgi:hypothetical protein
MPDCPLPEYGGCVYPAKLGVAGLAVFGLELTTEKAAATARVNVSRVAIAGIGARYHSL